MKLTKELVFKLKDENISKKQYDHILSSIDDIVRLVFPEIIGRGWYDYANGDYEAEDQTGYFSLREYINEVFLHGEFSLPEPYCLTDEGSGYFPTRWLWTDDEKIKEEYIIETSINRKIKESEKLEAKQKREALKEKKKKMKEIISSKLTKEELKFIKFK